MCGIAGFYVKDSYQEGEYDLEKLTDGLLLGIEERGQDATGMFTATRGGEEFDLYKDDIPATYFVQMRDFLPKGLRMALLHTRLATQGKPSKNENNHPVNFRSCFATHNGVIYNDRSIIDEVGEKRVAEVDSIAVPMLVATCGFDKALENLPKLQGSWALAIADPVTNPDELLLVRGISSPLVILDHPKLLVWASTQKAIQAAWEYAIGTAPDIQKYDWLQEGEATLLTADSQDANVLSFMTLEPWWKKDEEVDTMVYGTSDDWRDPRMVSHVSPTYAGDKVLCFECGERTAYFHLTESYTEPDGKYIEFDIPVCYKCEQELDADPKNLTYRYATQKVKIRAIMPDQMCYWCVRNKAVRFDKTGDAVCETCSIGDNQVSTTLKHQGTFRGGDDDKFFTLNPGDAIPENMKYAFGGCEACGSTEVAFVGQDGFVICAGCHAGEKVIASIDDELVLGTCEICDCSVLEESLKDGMFGKACRACRFGREETEVARAVVIPQRCDMCNGETDYLIRKDSMWMCRECKSDYGVELDCGHKVVGVGLAHDVRDGDRTLVVCANCLPDQATARDPESISKWAKLFRKGARA